MNSEELHARTCQTAMCPRCFSANQVSSDGLAVSDTAHAGEDNRNNRWELEAMGPLPDNERGLTWQIEVIDAGEAEIQNDEDVLTDQSDEPIYVDCDQNCLALNDPQTKFELKAALDHWRNHRRVEGSRTKLTVLRPDGTIIWRTVDHATYDTDQEAYDQAESTYADDVANEAMNTESAKWMRNHPS